MNADTPISPLWATLRKLLKSEGLDADSLSLDKLASALGVGRGTAQRIKEGHFNIRAETMRSLADRFGVSVSVIAQGAIDPILADAVDALQDKMKKTDRANFSPLAMHLAMAVDDIKDAEVRTKAFAAAAVAIQRVIDYMADPDKPGQ